MVAIKLTPVFRGRSKRLALICLPNVEDAAILQSNKNPIIEEPKPLIKEVFKFFYVHYLIVTTELLVS